MTNVLQEVLQLVAQISIETHVKYCAMHIWQQSILQVALARANEMQELLK